MAEALVPGEHSKAEQRLLGYDVYTKPKSANNYMSERNENREVISEFYHCHDRKWRSKRKPDSGAFANTNTKY